jgi:predicted flap endonuclease-1-like 5' DNA nuclease
MLELDLITGSFLLGAAAVGGLLGWFARGRQSSQELTKLGDDWQVRLKKAVEHNESLKAEISKMKTSVDAAKGIVEKHVIAAAKSKTEIASLREKQNALQKNLFVVGAERDQLKGQIDNQQNVVNAAKQRIVELQAESGKGLEIYKAQLKIEVEERKALQRKVEDAKSEQVSLNNLLESAKSEYESVSKLLTAAQAKVEDLNALENKVISLEADNAQLRHEVTLATQGAESLRREVSEFNALKEQNRELVQCLKSMENRCKQYEEDARRYRNQAEESEKESDTLRFKMGDIEKSFHEMQSEQKTKNKGKNSGNGKAEVKVNTPSPFGMSKPDGEVDDLTEIIGIGKVFEATLHELGIWHFRQIAAFGPAEIARINSELKEFKGRIEHDDWIGQAKELHFKKYGDKE